MLQVSNEAQSVKFCRQKTLSSSALKPNTKSENKLTNHNKSWLSNEPVIVLKQVVGAKSAGKPQSQTLFL